jgi:hypothetical protein
MKTLSVILLLLFLASCAPSRMQCGPGGGRRCVERTQIEKTPVQEKIKNT